jgi:ribosome-binding factor A
MSRGRATRGPGAPSQRQLRVGEVIRHALAEIFARGEVHDPDLDGLTITVPEVRLSPDLKIATVYVMPLGGSRQDRVEAALSRNSRFLRGEVARRVELKFMPELRFRLDTTFAEANRIETLLRSPEVARDLHHDDD